MRKLIVAFVRQEDGGVAVEYAFLLSLIVLGLVGSIQVLGVSVRGLYESLLAAFP